VKPVPNIPGWADRDSESRALAVLEWCDANGIHTASIMGYQLEAAMEEANKTIEEDDGISYEPSPMDYVHVVRVLAAFLRSRR
jgi:hypothetical protein